MAKPLLAGTQTTTTFQIGTYNPLNENASSDGFTLTADLNDGSTTFIMPGTMKAPAPDKTYVETGNIRSPGISVVRWQYKNRTIDLSISLRRSNYANLQATLATIKAALENPPYSIRFAYPGATQYSYYDVVECTHNIPSDPILWLNNALPHYEIHFVCLPGIRGDRVTLQNLVSNPGFEGPAGGGTAQTMPVYFTDSFANVNAYTVVSGSNPTVASNVMTIASGSRLTFGSPAWGPISMWQMRWQFATNLQPEFYLHFTNTTNYIGLIVPTTGTGVSLNQVVGGTTHALATGNVTLTNGTFYWIQFIQYPSLNGNQPMVQATLLADSAGSPGAALSGGTFGPVNTFDAVTALSGVMSIVARNAAMNVGGNFSNVQKVTGYGPGGWTPNGLVNTPTGSSFLAWDGTRLEMGMSGTATAGTQTYNAGPVTSFGSARIDMAPAGTVSAAWESYSGGTPAGSQAIPVSVGDVVYATAQCKTTGLGSGCLTVLQIREWDASGSFLRGTAVASFTGNKTSWFTLTGNVTTGSSCAYVSVLLWSQDTSAGASANGTVWFDNAQCWDATTTGLTTMSYHELRFPNSPAQLVVSGLLGDMPAPAFLALGTYQASWAPGGSNLNFVLGRQAIFQSGASPTAILCGQASYSGAQSLSLDTASWGGLSSTSPGSLTIMEYDAVQAVTLAMLGTYHLYSRAKTTQSTFANITTTASYREKQPAGRTGAFAVESTAYAPFAAANAWQPVDGGQMSAPPTPYGGITGAASDASTKGVPVMRWYDATGGGSSMQANWWSAVPVDSSLLIGSFVNPSGSGATVTTAWVWAYSDPLALNTGLQGAGAAWRYSLGGGAAEPPTNALGGPGSTSGNFTALNTSQDPYLMLDPTNMGQNSSGVNLLCGHISDSSATVLALHAEMQYSPLYLAPR